MAKNTNTDATAQTAAAAVATSRDGEAESLPSEAYCHVNRELEAHGLDLASLSEIETRDLDQLVQIRLARLFDEIVREQQEEHATLSDVERIDRELQRRIAAERDRIDHHYECDGCGHRHWNPDMFLDFHGLLLCDGCEYWAREELRDLQRPLIEALEADPTLERAHALGFELVRRADGRLAWVSDDDQYDGGSNPYTDPEEALQDLVAELA